MRPRFDALNARHHRAPEVVVIATRTTDDVEIAPRAQGFLPTSRLVPGVPGEGAPREPSCIVVACETTTIVTLQVLTCCEQRVSDLIGCNLSGAGCGAGRARRRRRRRLETRSPGRATSSRAVRATVRGLPGAAAW